VRCLVELVRAQCTTEGRHHDTTPAGSGGGAPDPGLSAIMNERRRLITLACRLPGSLADAEDACER
jgi:hypothetical protein